MSCCSDDDAVDLPKDSDRTGFHIDSYLSDNRAFKGAEDP